MIDKILLENIKELYNQVVILHSKRNDKTVDTFDLALKVLILGRDIAISQGTICRGLNIIKW